MYSQLQIVDTIKKFEIKADDIQRIREAGKLLKPELDDHIAVFYHWLRQHKEYQIFFSSNPKRLERVVELQKKHWESFFDANLDDSWFASRTHVGAVHAHIDLPNDIYFAGMSMSGKSLVDRIRKIKPALKDANDIVNSLMKLIFMDSFIVIEEISRIQKEKITAGSKALMEMSTPVTPIWEGILLLPLLGIIDSSRTQDIMNKTLSEIGKTRAKVFVLDISGVSAMDTAVANQLIKITKATQLMGCETIISGISPSIARTLVELGINIGEVKTTSTLRDSFELALKAVGVDVQLLGKTGN
jgi:rsbT co-antagonist protein RsbR